MQKNFKKTIAFIFFLLAGLTLGAFVSHICAGHKYLDWLAWGQTIGFSTTKPALLDLVFLKLSFGFEIKVTIAQIFTVIIAIITYNKTCKSL